LRESDIEAHLRDFDEGFGAALHGHAGVVDEDVDAPPERFGPIGEGLGLCFVAKVHCTAFGLETGGAQLGHPLGDARTAGGDDQLHARGAKAARDGHADAFFAAGTADQRDLTCDCLEHTHLHQIEF